MGSTLPDTSYEKEKPKGKPGQQLTCFGCVIWLIKSAIVMTALGILGTCGLFIFMILLPIFPPYLDSTQVAKTCDALDLLPDDSFCNAIWTQTPQALQAAFERRYPVNKTTLADLQARFGKSLDCYDEIACSLNMPLHSLDLIVWHKADSDIITGYHVYDQRYE